MKKMPTNIRSIGDVIGVLEQATRQGTEKDEPEGSRYITLSDTLVQEMIMALRRFY
jgi:hypothetical protein